MKTSAKWKWLTLTTCLLPTLAVSCSTTLRDSIMSGIIDLVTSVVPAALEALLPIARVLQPA